MADLGQNPKTRTSGEVPSKSPYWFFSCAAAGADRQIDMNFYKFLIFFLTEFNGLQAPALKHFMAIDTVKI